ncbi:MAG: diaminopimelate decarboxylase [Firmicutes bacterium]|nr:diaminopimelate decarboxylase [Bacillota bacterium]
MSNNMMFYGCDVAELVKEYGSPLYVMSEDDIRERCREVKSVFIDKYPNTRAVYASKAFQTLEICRIVQQEGIGLDVVSGGEIFAAIRAGVNPADIVFHGNTKTYGELKLALEENVGTIVVDNLSELALLDELAAEMGKVPGIVMRITPGVDSHTHEFISTGQEDSKFGFAIQEVIDFATEKAMKSSHLDFRGFHFHVGSQLHDNMSHLMAVDKVLDMLTVIKEKYGYVPRELNTGGGFGVHYAGDPERTHVSYFMDPVMEKIDAYFAKTGDPRPMITIEPGRWIVAEAGITVYEVGSVKTNAAGRTYIGVDGGFPDNPRPALYDAKYEVKAVEKYDEPYDQVVTVAGKCCESGDILIWDAELPKLERGDHIAVLCTGAYNYSMASNYNRVPRPAVVMVSEGKAHLSVRRETYEDLIAREL